MKEILERMKNKIENWFIRSAINDFQKGNGFILGMFVVIMYTFGFWIGLIAQFIIMFLADKYNDYGRNWYTIFLIEQTLEIEKLNLLKK